MKIPCMLAPGPTMMRLLLTTMSEDERELPTVINWIASR